MTYFRYLPTLQLLHIFSPPPLPAAPPSSLSMPSPPTPLNHPIYFQKTNVTKDEERTDRLCDLFKHRIHQYVTLHGTTTTNQNNITTNSKTSRNQHIMDFIMLIAPLCLPVCCILESGFYSKSVIREMSWHTFPSSPARNLSMRSSCLPDEFLIMMGS